MLAPDTRPPIDPRIACGVVVAVAIAGALLIGSAIGEEIYIPLLLLLGIIGIAAIPLVLKERSWVLIPCFWYLTGKLSVIPFNVRELAVITAFGIFVVFVALRLIRVKAKIEFLDWLVILNISYLASVFARNPVGVSALSSSQVGGRPYFDSAVGLLAFVILSRATLNSKLARRLPFLSTIPQIGAGLIIAITHYFPSTVPIFSRIYSEVDATEYALQENGDPEDEVSRVGGLLGAARLGLLALLAYFPPVSLLLPTRLFRSFAFLTVCFAFALAGFRNGIIYFAFAFIIAAYFRAGLQQALVATGLGFCILVLLISAQNAGLKLPITAQRALSFLPGEWDSEAKSSAEDSSEWRYDMWDVVLHSDKFIHNKILGDGFGFSSYELQIMEEQSAGGAGFVGGSRQETFLIQGAFHSGPLSAVRYVGAVGLGLYLFLLVVAAIYAWKLIVNSRGTDFFPLALFVGIPVVYEPFQYVLIFGGFDSGFPNTLYLCGMLKLVSKGVNNHFQLKVSQKARQDQPADLLALPPGGRTA